MRVVSVLLGMALIGSGIALGSEPAAGRVPAALGRNPAAERIPVRPPSPRLRKQLERPPRRMQDWNVRQEERSGRPVEVWYLDGRERLRIDRR